jgi:DNA-binding transcriptional regulator YhcF (GntR family)
MIMSPEQLDLIVAELLASANPVQQLAAIIAIQVSAGELPCNEPLPPGAELAHEFEASELVGNTALEILANARTGLIREIPLGYAPSPGQRYAANVKVTGRERPDPQQILRWCKGGLVEQAMADLADRIIKGTIRPGGLLPPDEEIVKDWQGAITEADAKRVKQRLRRYRGLVVFREEKFYAAEAAE